VTLTLPGLKFGIGGRVFHRRTVCVKSSPAMLSWAAHAENDTAIAPLAASHSRRLMLMVEPPVPILPTDLPAMQHKSSLLHFN
jgi:hypothetical protein